MNNNKILSALCYISLLFAPFLLPLIVYFVIKDPEVKFHAKRALLSHSIPTFLAILLAIAGFAGVLFTSYDNMNGFVWMMFAMMAIYFILSLIVIVWNFIQAFRIIR